MFDGWGKMRPARGQELDDRQSPKVKTSRGKDTCMRKQSAHYTKYYHFKDKKNESLESRWQSQDRRLSSSASWRQYLRFISTEGDANPPAASRRQSHTEGNHRDAVCRKGRQRMRRATGEAGHRCCCACVADRHWALMGGGAVRQDPRAPLCSADCSSSVLPA